MTKKPYGLVHAMSLLAPCGASDQWDITDCGVLPKPQPKLRQGQTQTAASHLEDFHPLLAWRPAVVFKDETPAPDLINTPSLPFPFDAKDLAAFMLCGVGSFVADFYGEWEDGPNKLAIDQINPLDTFARQAVIEAFAACREAQKNVGPFPSELYDKAERARKAWNEANKDANHRGGVFDSELDSQELEYRLDRARASMDVLELEIVAEAFETKAAILRTRRERAKESTATLELEMWVAAGEAGTAHQKWLEAMVRGLLEPGRVTPSPPTEQSAEERQTERWQACVNAGLIMPRDTYAQYPRGIGKVASSIGIKTQSLRDDLNKYRERFLGKSGN